MKSRAIRVVSLMAALMLVASDAMAVQVYSLMGRISSNRGAFIKIPIIGYGGQKGPNCGNFKWVHQRVPVPTKSKRRITGSPAAGNPRTGGMLFQPGVVLASPAGADPFGCVPGGLQSTDVKAHTKPGNVTATAPGVGARFTIPAPMSTTKNGALNNAFFHRPLPGRTLAVHIPNEAQFPQLATSFRIDAPAGMIPLTGPDMAGGLFRTPKTTPLGMSPAKNLAPLRKFMKSAWKGGPAKTFNGQTGRPGPNFTFCLGNAGCALITNGTGANGRLLVKYHAGPNKFGGTMQYVITTGPGHSNLALATAPGQMTAGGYGKALELLALAGHGQQPSGRGYADKHTDMVKTGPLWAHYKVGNVFIPEIGMSSKLITMVKTLVKGGKSTATALININYGFPLTTGTVFDRATGSTLPNKAPLTSTNTAMGYDKTNNGGKGRILTLVAGQVARTTLGSNTPGIFFMPEPSHVTQLLAGALGLAGVALWRARRRQ